MARGRNRRRVNPLWTLLTGVDRGVRFAAVAAHYATHAPGESIVLPAGATDEQFAQVWRRWSRTGVPAAWVAAADPNPDVFARLVEVSNTATAVLVSMPGTYTEAEAALRERIGIHATAPFDIEPLPADNLHRYPF